MIKIYSLIHRYRHLDTIAEESYFNKLGRLLLCQPFFLNKPHTHTHTHTQPPPPLSPPPPPPPPPHTNTHIKLYQHSNLKESERKNWFQLNFQRFKLSQVINYRNANI